MRAGTLPSFESWIPDVRDFYLRLVAPTAYGLPNRVVALWFPCILLVVFIVLVASGINGSSSGVFWGYFGTGADPQLLHGEPRPIRSDEWLVQSSWIVSQYQQGFPVLNQTLPGGMDATVQNDLPSWDWSTFFRPHLFGFLALPMDQGMAVRWWLPAFAMVGACYSFVVSLLPRRPLTAVFLSGALLLTPIIQWWFLPTTIWPVALAFTAMTGIVWMLRHPKLRVRLSWAAAIAYVAVATAMSIYVPFIVPAALVVVFFLFGMVLSEWRSGASPVKDIALRLIPLVAAGVAAGLVLGIWILTRLDTIKALFATVYPGQRLEATGTVDLPGLIGLMGGPFEQALEAGTSAGLGPNQSEAASVLLVALFMLIPLIWLITRHWSENRSVDWLLCGIVACTLLVLAFMIIPGWDSLAHILFLDRSPASRMRLAFAILGIVSVVVFVERLENRRVAVPWSASWIAAGVVVLSVAAPWLWFRLNSPETIASSPSWKIATIALVLSVFAFTRRWTFLGAVSLFAVSLVVGSAVNPLYRGVFDVNDTYAGRQIQQLNSEDPGTWIGIGTHVPAALLVRSGVEAMVGVQTYPPKKMWRAIDPTGSYENEWNRLANVAWKPGQGNPMMTNPARDQILVSFDSCSPFAQKHVQYVLSEVPVDQECLTLIEDIPQGLSRHLIYEVTPG